MLIGYMHNRKDPNKTSKIYTIAAACKIEGAEFCYFSPGQIDFEKQKILGYYYDKKWIQKEFPFPDVVINMIGAKTEKQIKNVDKLKEIVPFTESMIHNKHYIQELLENHPIFKTYLPECIIADNKKRVEAFLDKHKKIVLKPSVGSRGENIYFISKNENRYLISYDNFEEYVNDLSYLSDIDLSQYILQEFIISETIEGLPADYRIHTQKNEKGNYVIATIYPRIGNKKNRVSNLSQGGYSTKIDLFLKNQFKDNWLTTYNKLKILGLQVSEYLDDYYDNELNQLGIDICIDKNNKLYIIEANWRPGLAVLFADNINHIKNLIKYCFYLVYKQSK